MSTTNQPSMDSITATELFKVAENKVHLAFERILDLAMCGDYEKPLAHGIFQTDYFIKALKQLNGLQSYICDAVEVRAMRDKKIKEDADKQQASPDKKSHDEVNKDLGSTVWIDEQLEFTLPEQPTEEPSSPISPDGSLDLTAELLAMTHVIEYSPNCAQRFLIRIPGYGKPYIDKRSPGTTDDAIGYGNNPEDAFKQALAKREEQKGAKQ